MVYFFCTLSIIDLDFSFPIYRALPTLTLMSCIPVLTGGCWMQKVNDNWEPTPAVKSPFQQWSMFSKYETRLDILLCWVDAVARPSSGWLHDLTYIPWPWPQQSRKAGCDVIQPHHSIFIISIIDTCITFHIYWCSLEVGCSS